MLFTSESVTEGHPDKICDRISDSILDECLKRDPESKVAIETMALNGTIIIGGEVTTSAYVDVEKTVRDTLRYIGGDKIDWKGVGILNSIHSQSPDIAMGVNKENSELQGAGDQGMMFGYACNETEDYMPLPIYLAHKICKELADLRHNGLTWIMPDGKAQVTVRYGAGSPKVDTIVISTQHDDSISTEEIRNFFRAHFHCFDYTDSNTKFLINPTGRFLFGGWEADTGLTGRKIIVDTYGGMGRHGGGAFSGKDPSKVDRSGAYAARWVAKNIVAAGLADKCEVQISYAIGVPDPVSITVNTFHTSHLKDYDIEKAVGNVFDLRPGMIIKNFNLKRPIYTSLSSYGHFGRKDLSLPWEDLDKIEELKNAL